MTKTPTSPKKGPLIHSLIAVIAILAFIYSITAGRIERSTVSGPIIFVTAGIILGPLGLDWFHGPQTRNDLRLKADLTLVLILFSDAANANLTSLKSNVKVPTRMLLVGLPGVVLLGFGFALVLFNVLDSGLPGGKFIALVVIVTVFFSLIAHGISAKPMTNWLLESQES